MGDDSLDAGGVSDDGMNVCVYDDVSDVVFDVVCDDVCDVVCNNLCGMIDFRLFWVFGN